MDKSRRKTPAGTVDPRNSLNDLDGSEWMYFTRSVLMTTYPSEYGHSLRKEHGANKPPELMRHLINFFTKPGGKVLDPFAGVGGTLIGAMICDPPRPSLGIEINHRWVQVYNRVCASLAKQGIQTGLAKMVEGDCLEVMKNLESNSFQFIAMDPPYNLHFQRTMCNGRYDEAHANRRTDYDMRSNQDNDLANMDSYESYLDSMEEVFGSCYRVLEPGRYMVVIIRNAYQNGRYIFTHADLAYRASDRGFVPKGEIVWYQAGARLRPYGYPYRFVPNIIHQYILVFQKDPCPAH